MRALLVLLCVLCLALSPGYAQEDEDVDPVALAALLISDGHWDRAAAVLADVDPTDEGLDLARYHTLRGLVHLQAGEHLLAAEALEAALAAGATDPWLRLHLAQAYISGGDPQAALRVLDQNAAVVDPIAEAWLLRAQAWRAAEDRVGAWVALSQGAVRFPDRDEFDQQRVLLLVELGLYQEAREMGQAVLRARGASADTWIIIAEAMKRSNQRAQAAILLEEARLRFPEHPDLPKHLAQVYLADGKPLAAATVLQVAAERDPALYQQSAECFRRAGQVDAALRMNQLVPDPTEKTRQRLSILLEAQDFERMVALAPRLSRLGLLEDDNIRYGLAYAWFMLGEVDAAEAQLKRVRDPEIFRQATQLRQAMEACREAGSCGT
ncbi:MAG: tetratricopeptide repeat protein [Alphaproteobacteria bacterium]|nr:tetratricopeptide repeat protein [Alphaproteobacteria bacterium]